MNTRRIALVASVAVAAGATLALAGSVAVAGGGDGKGVTMRDLQGVNFISSCRFSHRKNDDPIVFPGKPGLSHEHSFVGNRTTSAFSTLDSLRAGATSCRREGDTAAYWMPTLIVDGSPVAPLGATIYYRRKTIDELTPFPAGLKVIAGNSHSVSAQSLLVTFWNCGVEGGFRASSTVPTCPTGSMLRLHVNFPNCWDGANVDSADHQSHMAYSVRGRCPTAYPVAVPAISLIFRYPSAGGPTAVLSSGGQYSGHADFFNAWQQGRLTALVESCLNALRHCGHGGPGQSS